MSDRRIATQLLEPVSQSVGRRRQCFHAESEIMLNQHIAFELAGHMTYLGMAYHFARPDVALLGYAALFERRAEQKLKFAEELMQYQNKRGGQIRLETVPRPRHSQWGSGLEALRQALEIERQGNEAHLALSALASRLGDAHLTEFTATKLLAFKLTDLRSLAGLCRAAERAGPGTGDYLVDKHLLQSQSTASS